MQREREREREGSLFLSTACMYNSVRWYHLLLLFFLLPLTVTLPGDHFHTASIQL